MSAAVLIDAGSLVAILHRDDEAHTRCTNVFQGLSAPLVTAWPTVTEAMYLLSFDSRAQDALWEMVARGAVSVAALDRSDIPRIRELMTQYSDLPMDFADAALVRVAERERIGTVFTVDADFRVYVPRHAPAFELIP